MFTELYKHGTSDRWTLDCFRSQMFNIRFHRTHTVDIAHLVQRPQYVISGMMAWLCPTCRSTRNGNHPYYRGFGSILSSAAVSCQKGIAEAYARNRPSCISRAQNQSQEQGASAHYSPCRRVQHFLRASHFLSSGRDLLRYLTPNKRCTRCADPRLWY